MRQQVNLYTPELRPKKALFDFRQVAWMALALLVLIALAGIGLGWRSQLLARHQAGLKQKVEALQSQQSQLSKRLNQIQADPGLQQSVKALKQSVKQRQGLLRRLHQVTANTAHGFSPVLTALARQSLPKLWLTDIRVNGESGAITLSGSTTDPETLPHYLARLHDEPAFSGKAFAGFHMQQDPKKHGILDFVLASHGAQNLAETGQ